MSTDIFQMETLVLSPSNCMHSQWKYVPDQVHLLLTIQTCTHVRPKTKNWKPTWNGNILKRFTAKSLRQLAHPVREVSSMTYSFILFTFCHCFSVLNLVLAWWYLMMDMKVWKLKRTKCRNQINIWNWAYPSLKGKCIHTTFNRMMLGTAWQWHN